MNVSLYHPVEGGGTKTITQHDAALLQNLVKVGPRDRLL